MSKGFNTDVEMNTLIEMSGFLSNPTFVDLFRELPERKKMIIVWANEFNQLKLKDNYIPSNTEIEEYIADKIIDEWNSI